MKKHNYFVTFLKKINLSINILLKKYLNKLNFNNFPKKKSIILNSNRVYLTLVLLFFLFFLYLLIPHTYNKTEIKA